MLLSSILGGLTGLVGGITTAVANYKMKKLEIDDKKNERQFLLEKSKIDIQEVELEAKCALQKAQAVAKAQEDIADAQVYKVSQKASQMMPLISSQFLSDLLDTRGALRYPAKILAFILIFIFAIIDVIRQLIRPSITVYQGAITTWLAYKAWLIIQQVHGFTPQMATDIFLKVTDVIIYLTVSVFTWWFGDRTTMKFLQNHTKFGGN